MREVACSLCGDSAVSWWADYRELSDRSNTYRIARCRSCNLVYLKTRPSAEELLRLSAIYQRLLREMRTRLMSSTIAPIGIHFLRRSRTPGVARPGATLLDIGCATGEYLAWLREIGWKATGIEMDAGAAAYARENFGLDVVTGTAEEAILSFPGESFDVVTMWHVLEHLANPRAVLEQVRRVLKPAGRLHIEVPNFQSFWAQCLGENWFTLEYPYHFSHFTEQTLTRILSVTGFEVRKLHGRAAPAETTWSLQMVWNRLRNREWDGGLLWSPAAIVALYPLEALLACVGRTNHMYALAFPRT